MISKTSKLFILSRDLTISTIVILLILKFNGFSDNAKLLAILIIYFTANVVLSLLFKTSIQLIKYTGLVSLKIIFLKEFIASICMVLILVLITEYEFFKIFEIVAYVFILNSIFILLPRFFKQKLIHYKRKKILPKKNIFIYGSGEAGVSVTKSLGYSNKAYYNILGYIDDDTSKVGSLIEGVYVYSIDYFLNFAKANSNLFLELIISSTKIPIKRKTEIILFCNEYKITVKTVPTVDDWIDDDFFDKKDLKKININDLINRDIIVVDINKIKLEVENKIILVTGAAGSIGSEITKQICKYNPKIIIAIDIAETPLHNLKLDISDKTLIAHTKIIYKTLSIIDYNGLKSVFDQYNPDIVYHAAAFKHVPLMEDNPKCAVENNIIGTFNLLKLVNENSTFKFIYISTDKAVNPTNVMGATKRFSELLVQYFSKLDSNKSIYVTTRFGNVLGSNGSVIPRFQQLIDNNTAITLTSAKITRYFMTIPEACSLVLDASTFGKNSQIFVFDMGKPVKILDLAKKMLLLNGLNPESEDYIKYIGLRPGEKLTEELLTESDNCLPTHNEKLFVAIPDDLKSSNILSGYNSLKKHIELNSDDHTIVKILKDYIPEFISNNSVFTSLD